VTDVLLTRLSAQYSEKEDRIRLMGEDLGGNAVEIWCTQRLLSLVIGHLCGLIEQQVEAVIPAPSRVQGVAQAVSSAEQQFAAATFRNEQPVQVTRSARSWLVHTIDIHRKGNTTRLVFKGDHGVAAMDYDMMLLRQWIHILFKLYAMAGWQRQGWPDWVTSTAAMPTHKINMQ
jgi:hypothetical protein